MGAEMRNTRVFARRTSTPTVIAASSSSRTAVSASPYLLRSSHHTANVDAARISSPT